MYRSPDRQSLQGAGLDLIDGFASHDATGLARLTSAERADQLRLRRALYAYVDGLWDHAKERGLSPADLPEEYGAVAGLRDLMMALFANAERARRIAADAHPDDEDEAP